jgi:hypothetical protein
MVHVPHRVLQDLCHKYSLKFETMALGVIVRSIEWNGSLQGKTIRMCWQIERQGFDTTMTS